MPFIPLFIIVLFLVLIDPFSLWAYKEAETLSETKAQSLERENLDQTKMTSKSH